MKRLSWYLIVYLWLSGIAWGQGALDYIPGDDPHKGVIKGRVVIGGNLILCTTNQVVTGFFHTGTQRCEQIQLSWLSDNANILTNTSIHRVSGKQITPREVLLPIVSDTVTPNIDDGDDFIVTAIAAPLTIANPTGTGGNPQPSQEFSLCLYSSTPRALTFGNQYTGRTAFPLPITTTGDGAEPDCYKFKRRSSSSTWNLIGSTQNTATTTGVMNLPMTGIKLHTTSPTGPSVSGENSIIWFDAATSECVVWEAGTLPPDYVGSPVLRMWYVMLTDTNTSHTATFDVKVMALKSGVTIHTNSFDSANNCDDSNIPGTVGVWNDISCALTNNDTMVANDPVKLEVCSDVATGSWTDDLGLFRARIEYARQ